MASLPVSVQRPTSSERTTVGHHGGGFVIACEDLRRVFDSFIPRLRFFFLCGDYLARTNSPL